MQIANSEEAAAIDPLADGIDLTPLLDLLCERKTTDEMAGDLARRDTEAVLQQQRDGGLDERLAALIEGKCSGPAHPASLGE